MTNSTVARAVRTALVTAGALGAGLYGATGVAQETALKEIVVTGSRIAQSGYDSISPVQIVGSADIDATGAANIQEVLLKNPAFGTPTLSRTNSNFLVSSAGVSTIDLRNLGTARTLVLVDGRRHVAGIPGTSAVDLNAIPAQFIERIDVLTGGASALYGSDAMAGVVNMVYKKDFEGIEIETQYGRSSEDDDSNTQIGLTMGVNSADGRGNLMAHLGYTKQGPVFSADRDRSAIDQFSLGRFTLNPADFYTPVVPFFSSFPPQGRFSVGGTTYTFDSNNNLLTGFSTNGSATRAPDGFNRSAHRTIAVPTERYLFAARGSYEFADGHSAFFEGTYANSQTKSRLEPFPLSSGDIYEGSGRMPIEFATFVPDPNNPGQFTRTVTVNPLVPAALVAVATDTDSDGMRDIGFVRRLSEVGNRGNVADRDTFRIVGGFQGSLFSDNWDYELYYSYGQTKEAQVSGGQVNVQSFRQALEAIPDPANPGQAMCRDAIARNQGCVPASLFGFGSLSQGAVGYITAPGLLASFISQKVAGLNITGEAFDMPAGPVGIAVGAEYRKEFSRSEFDPLQSAGLNAGNAIPREEGEFDVSEGYLEVNVPLLRDLPAVDRLNFRGAVRAADYSTVGSTTAWNAGLEWAPNSQIRLRGIYSESVRAPNITELFSPPSQTFPPGLNDPCLGVTATSTTSASAACRADPGVAANIAANGTFTLNQADLQGISGFNRGNPNLFEESGESWTLGLVISPESIPVLRDMRFSIDYFRIDIQDAIVSTPRQFILDQCYTGDPSFCQFITRRPMAVGTNSAGSIEFIDSAVTNSGGLFTEGVDFQMAYQKDLADWGLAGRLNATLSYTHVMEGYVIPLPNADKDPFAGESGGAENKAFVALGYTWGDFGATWRTTYIGESALDGEFLAAFGAAPGTFGWGSWMYHDVQFTWTPDDRYEVFLGGTNVFDKDPPPIISGLPFSNTGTETDAGTYDPIGARWYAGVRVKF